MDRRKVIRKVCLLGDGGVGKTSLIRRFVFDCFSDEYIVSFGTKVTKKVIDYDDVQLTLMIWDVLGQRAQRSLHMAYYGGASGALLVCDSTREETLMHLPEWMRGFLQVAGDRPVVPVINKSDLGSSLSPKALSSIEDEMGSLLLTSAKSGEGVQEAFERLGRMVLEARA